MANIDVNSGGDVQAALDSAVAGDVVRLEANALFTGTFRLKNKGNSDYITITTNGFSTPAAGTRITLAAQGSLARLKSSASEPVLRADPGSGYWKIIGLEFEPNPNGISEILRLGDNDNGGNYQVLNDFQLRSKIPHHMQVDRCIIRGDVFKGQKRAIFLNCSDATVTCCHIDRIFLVGQDANAIATINSNGPLTITNNYMEGAAYHFIAGGADPVAYTEAQLAAGASTTSGTLQSFRLGNGNTQHDVNSQGELTGQWISILYGGGANVHHAIVQSRSGNAITWDPACPSTPDTGAGSAVRWGANPSNLTFRRNYCVKPTAWKNAMLATPTGVGTAETTGSLAAGTYYYRVQAIAEGTFSAVGEYRSDAAAEVSRTLASTGGITVSWNSVTNATKYRVWGRAQGAQDRYFETASLSLTDTGAAGTVAALPTGSRPTVKNCFELKACKTAQVDSNQFDNHWKGAFDIGFTCWFKSVNQEGKGTFIKTDNITFEKNWFKNVEGCFLTSGQEYYSGNASKPVRMTNLIIRNNVWENSTLTRTANIGSAPNPILIDHNTILHSQPESDLATVFIYGELNAAMTITNNLGFRKFEYGVRVYDENGGGTQAEGSFAALATYGGSMNFQKNAVVDANSANYPANNVFPTEAQFQAAFTNYNGGSGGDYHVANGHQYNDFGLDGKDLGADIDLVTTALTGVTTGAAEGTDSEAPVTAITSPTQGATVSGTTAISATASDNVGVSRVELWINGVLSQTDTASPYSFSWNTTLTSNGVHTLQTRAFDAANNEGQSSIVTVTVNNVAPPPPPPVNNFVSRQRPPAVYRGPRYRRPW